MEKTITIIGYKCQSMGRNYEVDYSHTTRKAGVLDPPVKYCMSHKSRLIP